MALLSSSRQRLALLLALVAPALLLACGEPDVEIAGSVVKGPVARAQLTAHAFDAGAPNFLGDVVDTGRTRRDGTMSGLEINLPQAHPVLLVSTGGRDLTTHRTPVVPVLRTLLLPEQIAGDTPVYATPLTTLTIEIAERNADTRRGRFAGNEDGYVSAEELVASLDVAQGIIASTFGLGVLDDVDLFTTPPVIVPWLDDDAARRRAVDHRVAIEAFTALLVELAAAADASVLETLDALALDLTDGLLDASAFGDSVEHLPDVDTLTTIVSRDPADLRIPRTGLRVADLGAHMARESLITAPGARIHPRDLEVRLLEPVSLVVDSDGDGAMDLDDAFPGDPAETNDGDGDGVGDGGDAYPDDAGCWAESDGDGVACTATRLKSLDVDRLAFGEDGVLRLLVGDERAILRWDLRSGHFLEPIALPETGGAPTHIAHSANHGRLYIGFADGAVRYVEPATAPAVHDFLALSTAIKGLAAADRSLVVHAYSSSRDRRHYFDRDGIETEFEYSVDSSDVFEWNDATHRLYALKGAWDPRGFAYTEVDPGTGTVLDRSSSPRPPDYDVRAPLIVSEEGHRVMLGNGDVYGVDPLEISASLNLEISAGQWPAGAGPIVLVPNESDTTLRRYDGALELSEEHRLEGLPRGLFDVGDAFVAVLETAGHWRLERYVPDDDVDGDGVDNLTDAFPRNPAASVDSDGDGAPDAWNAAGGSTDRLAGLVLDAFPLDSACQLPSHALPGAPDACDPGAAIPAYVPDDVVVDDAGRVHLLSREHGRIFRWSTDSGAHLNPIVVPPSASLITYSDDLDRLYVGHDDGEITRIEVDAPMPTGAPYARMMRPVRDLETMGSFLFAVDVDRSEGSHATFAPDGSAVSRLWRENPTRAIAWSPRYERMLYIPEANNVGGTRSVDIDPATGEILGDGRAVGGSPDDVAPMRISRDGSRYLLGAGDLFDAETFFRLRSMPVEPHDFAWLDAGELVTIREVEGGRTLLEYRGADLKVLDVRLYEGTPVRVVVAAEEVVVISHDGDRPRFEGYEVGVDGDGDGVAYADDDFPRDPAASVDTDGDGHPDAWNPGMGPADSLEGLSLDAFPEDVACHLPAHGRPDAPGVCDLEARLPLYVPDAIVSDVEGTVYLLSSAEARIFRWSISSESDVDPIPIDPGATTLAYSGERHELLLGFDTGAVTRIALDAAHPREAPLTATRHGVGVIEAIDPWIYVIEAGQSYALHSTFDAAGEVVTAGFSAYTSSATAGWSASASRMFTLKYPGDYATNYLHALDLDPETGEIVGYTSTRSNRDGHFKDPIRISRDGEQVLFASGWTYGVDSLAAERQLPTAFVDAVWLESGGLVTVREQAGETLVEEWGPELALYESEVMEGTPVGVLAASDGIVVVHLVGGATRLTAFVSSGDADDDGVPNLEDAFPIDPAASVDTDGDHAPDAWHPGMDEGDSTTGLILDAFPLDAACQLPEHGHADDPGRCDHANGVPEYAPDGVAVDASGALHMLSNAHDRIFRWSADVEEHLAPIDVRADTEFFTHSPALDTLYLSYRDGTITQIDLSAPVPTESPFATVPATIRGIRAADHLLFVSTADDAHWLIRPDGTIADGPVTARYSATDTLEWSGADQRMYYLGRLGGFRDLRWREVDPTTETLGDAPSLPSGSSFASYPPLHVSPDGALALLSSGAVIDLGTLTLAGELRISIFDAVWLDDGSVITLRPHDDGGTILEHWSDTFVLQNAQHYAGPPIALERALGHVVVVTSVGEQPVFSIHVPSTDGDGDGVPFDADRFPLDPAASQDTDLDGYPDAWNPGMGPGDSTTGLVLDAFPGDSACQLPEHAVEEQPSVCDIAARIPAFTPTGVVADDAGVVHLLSGGYGRIFRWSAASHAYLNPIPVDTESSRIAFSEESSAFYVSRTTGEISRLDADALYPMEEPFAETPRSTRALETAGPFVFAIDDESYSTHYTFGPDGSPVSVEPRRYTAHALEWAPVQERMYSLRTSSSTGQVAWDEIDASTGEITAESLSDYDQTASFHRFLRTSPDGSRLLTGSGEVYDTDTFDRLGSLVSEGLHDAVWLDGGGIVTIRGTGYAETVVEQWSDDYVLYNATRLAGTPFALLETAGHVVVVTRMGSFGVELTEYVPTDDADSDGVPNADDDFPLDPSASIDSDGDGAPDAWNPGRGPADSPVGLVLDAFPDDAECQLPEHGLPTAPDVCDLAHGVPEFATDEIEFGEDGVVYALSEEHGLIFRWSSATGLHLEPIPTGEQPEQLAYSAESGRLYVSYATGEITQIALDDPALAEQPFAVSPDRPIALATAGAIVVSIDDAGDGYGHHTFAPDGTAIDTRQWFDFTWHMEWSPVTERMYFMFDASTPRDLSYEEIDPATGTYGDSLTAPYVSGTRLAQPIRVSADGSRLFLGTGLVFDAHTLLQEADLHLRFEDATWLSDGRLVTIREDGAGGTLLEHWNADLSLYDLALFEGAPLRIAAAGSDLVVVTQLAGKPAYAHYEPTDDADGDGTLNWQDAFPLDPSASVDSDLDGAPDAWNPGMSDADSTEALVLDAFPLDSACQLAEHALASDAGLCDIAGQVPDYVPDRVVVDARGTFHLLSIERERIYRWSSSTRAHMNPYVVGAGVTDIAYSDERDVLHAAYRDRGEITQIDPTTAIPVEAPFIDIDEPIHGLIAIGSRLFVSHDDPWRYAHSTFDASGALIDTAGAQYAARDLEFSEATGRVYFVRPDTRARPLQARDFDPATGLLGEEEQTAPVSQDHARAPIRPDPTGTFVLTGTGLALDAQSLWLYETLPDPFTDILWLEDGHAVTVRDNPTNELVVEQWSGELVRQAVSLAPGAAHRVIETGGEIFLVSILDGRPAFSTYEWIDDGDADGVDNELDAFPTDPAASVDSDGDGQPDAWNPGMGEGDSTLALFLDAFPLDFACQLPEHGIDGECDFEHALPAAYDEPFCSEDVVPAAASSGVTSTVPFLDIVPLCSGWAVVNEQGTRRVSIRNLVSNRLGAQWAFPFDASALAIDEERKILYVAVQFALKVYAVDLVSGAIGSFDVPDHPLSVAVDPEGGLFVLGFSQASGRSLVWRAPEDGALSGPWPFTNNRILYNRATDELIATGYQLDRYAFDAASGPVLLESTSSGNIYAPALSDDGLHLAAQLVGGSSNVVRDVDASSFANVLGSWTGTAFATGAAFAPGSEWVATSNGSIINVHDVGSHGLQGEFNVGQCASPQSWSMAVSRGGRIILRKAICRTTPAEARVDWVVP